MSMDDFRKKLQEQVDLRLAARAPGAGESIPSSALEAILSAEQKILSAKDDLLEARDFLNGRPEWVPVMAIKSRVNEALEAIVQFKEGR